MNEVLPIFCHHLLKKTLYVGEAGTNIVTINVNEGSVSEFVGFLHKQNLKYFVIVFDGLNELLGRTVLKNILDLCDMLLV